MFVSFTSVVEFLFIVMFTGGAPMAEHDSCSLRARRSTRMTGAGNTVWLLEGLPPTKSTTLGDTSKKTTE